MSILSDKYEPCLSPIANIKPMFMVADGIFSPLQRAQRLSPLLQLHPNSSRHKSFYSDWLSETQYEIIQDDDSVPIRPESLINNLASQIESDVSLLNQEEFTDNVTCEVLGKNRLYIHKTVELSKFVSIDMTDGPVVIDSGCKISAFTLLKGPLYLGPNCIVDRATIKNSRVGQSCRLGGEIEASLIGDYSNKHHDGFLGHSIVGDWVNLGASTTTSDLKNNYGKIKLHYNKHQYDTDEIKFGSIIGDFVKTAIGTMLNTGTIIDTAAVLYHPIASVNYFKPFFWGNDKESYRLERFLADTMKIMARRSEQLSEAQRNSINALYNS